jgi:hypothetical protein
MEAGPRSEAAGSGSEPDTRIKQPNAVAPITSNIDDDAIDRAFRFPKQWHRAMLQNA